MNQPRSHESHDPNVYQESEREKDIEIKPEKNHLTRICNMMDNFLNETGSHDPNVYQESENQKGIEIKPEKYHLTRICNMMDNFMN